MVPASFIQDLLSRIDIADVVGRYVQLKKRGQNWLGLCPFHGEKSPSFTVSPSKQFFHCFGCGAHGSAIGFLMDFRGMGYVDAIQELAQQVGLTVPQNPEEVRRVHRQHSLVDLMRQAATFYAAELKESIAVDYLKSRGVTGRTALRFGLGYSPAATQDGLKSVFADYANPDLVEAGLVIESQGRRYDRFRDRLMFPIKNRRGSVIGFGGRTLAPDGQPKYLNSPETPLFRKGHELYGLHEAQEAIRKKSRVIVCEGYLDVIQLAQAGFEESVATLGTALTVDHIQILFKLVDSIIFSFDGDSAGIKAARRALEEVLPVISDNKRISFLILPDGLDPDDFIRQHGSQAFEDQLTDALPFSKWFERCVLEGLDMSSLEDRAQAVGRAKEWLTKMAPCALRVQVVTRMAELTKIPAPEVEALFGVKTTRPVILRKTAALAGRKPASVGPLSEWILELFLAYPSLVLEFSDRIQAEFAGQEDETSLQIMEVWAVVSDLQIGQSGILLEALGDSLYLAKYHGICAKTIQFSDDEDDAVLISARQTLLSGFDQLELGRVDRELAQIIQQGTVATERERVYTLVRRQAELKSKRVVGQVS